MSDWRHEPIPEWSELYTKQELESAIKIFKIYSEFPKYKKHAATNSDLKILFQLASKTVAPTNQDNKKITKSKIINKKLADRQLLQNTLIRKNRGKKLVGSSTGSFDLPLPPAKLNSIADLELYANDDDKVMLMEHHDDNIEEHHSKQESSMPQEEFLNYAKSCHICPNKFKKLHHFYDQLCPNCAEFNYQKRFYSSNMEGRVCIVTGARVKIGYCIALKLLRMGATVIITTRFPHNAAIRYSKEPDFEMFAKQLHIYGIDFRDMTMVHQFCSKIKSNFNRMDVIINNAAQTVRKPTQFYKHLILDESIIPNKEVYSKMSITNVYREENGEYQFVLLDSTKDTNPSKATDGLQSVVLSNLSASTGNSLSTVANLSSKLSQVPLTMEDIETQNTRLFPLNVYDRDDQQVDLRKENSWTQEIGNISIVEMFECQVINVIAPWILISELKEMMVATKSLDDESLPIDKYIVNVSAMEGQFYRPKTTCHPHSNMAKASLNMLTRTSASGFAALNIFMTAVDTGWITDENPVDQWEKRENAPPPLDEWDAAMRVLDPVLTGINGDGDKKWGIFLKNYTPTRW